MHGIIQWPRGYGIKDLVAYGISGLVVLDRSTNTIIKSPHGQDEQPFIDLEKAAYERLSTSGCHPGILRYYGPYSSTPSLMDIRLEYAPNSALHYYLSNRVAEITDARRIRWAVQITDALSYIHSHNIIHGDLTCLNIFLTADLDAKIGDFAGSSIDGSHLPFQIMPSHRFPGTLQSVKADIFALGSDFYQMWTGFPPYHDIEIVGLEDGADDKKGEEIICRFSRGEFPHTESLGLVGEIISRCWLSQYEDLNTIRKDINGLSKHMKISFEPSA